MSKKNLPWLVLSVPFFWILYYRQYRFCLSHFRSQMQSVCLHQIRWYSCCAFFKSSACTTIGEVCTISAHSREWAEFVLHTHCMRNVLCIPTVCVSWCEYSNLRVNEFWSLYFAFYWCMQRCEKAAQLPRVDKVSKTMKVNHFSIPALNF